MPLILYEYALLQYTLHALQMAMKQATEDELNHLIHHSDRGVQYCCNAYTEELLKHGVRISMTEDYKPTDNAIAERVNGILNPSLTFNYPFFLLSSPLRFSFAVLCTTNFSRF